MCYVECIVCEVLGLLGFLICVFSAVSIKCRVIRGRVWDIPRETRVPRQLRCAEILQLYIRYFLVNVKLTTV